MYSTYKLYIYRNKYIYIKHIYYKYIIHKVSHLWCCIIVTYNWQIWSLWFDNDVLVSVPHWGIEECWSSHWINKRKRLKTAMPREILSLGQGHWLREAQEEKLGLSFGKKWHGHGRVLVCAVSCSIQQRWDIQVLSHSYETTVTDHLQP